MPVSSESLKVTVAQLSDGMLMTKAVLAKEQDVCGVNALTSKIGVEIISLLLLLLFLFVFVFFSSSFFVVVSYIQNVDIH